MNLQTATKIAIKTAKESTLTHRIGAILYDRSNYCTACNRSFSECIVNSRTNQYSDHAESRVITKSIHYNIDFKHSTLVVVRVNRKGRLMLSRPCPSCTKLIEKFEIPRVYYSNDPLHRSRQNFKSLS